MNKAVFNHTAHKALWNWLAKTGNVNKQNWPGWFYKGGKVDPVRAECFACEYTFIVTKRDSEIIRCEKCPIRNITTENKSFYCCIREFIDWDNTKESEIKKKKKELAAKIRDLPIREDFEGTLK